MNNQNEVSSYEQKDVLFCAQKNAPHGLLSGGWLSPTTPYLLVWTTNMLFLFAFRPAGLQRVNKFTLGGACAKHGYPLRGLHGEESPTLSICGATAPSAWTTDHTQRVAALCLAPRCSTSQTLTCAWAHFQSVCSFTPVWRPPAFR